MRLALNKQKRSLEIHMKQFKVFKSRSGEIQAVKQGWCWPAFFFTSIWAMVAKMWALGIGSLVAVVAISIFFEASGISVGNAGSIGLSVLFGLKGNEFREKHLLSRGFELQDTVRATSMAEAVSQFVSGKAQKIAS
jgi:hypothetical protein